MSEILFAIHEAKYIYYDHDKGMVFAWPGGSFLKIYYEEGGLIDSYHIKSIRAPNGCESLPVWSIFHRMPCVTSVDYIVALVAAMRKSKVYVEKLYKKAERAHLL